MTQSEEKSILIIDDEIKIRELIVRALEGRKTDTAASSAEAKEKIKSAKLAILDLKLLDGDGMTLLKEFRENYPEIPIIIITAFATIEIAVEAMKSGARDFITKPFSSLDHLRLVVDRAVRESELADENRNLKELLAEQDKFEEMIGSSDIMKKLYNMIHRISDGDSTVLITGESGTGKELAARAIHRRSQRNTKPFVEINCAAIPETLLESELFGYEKGAFTGAYKQKKGLFETANSGTLFLDEIGEMPLSLQVKLLRVIEEKSFVRLGGTVSTKIDVRIIAASNKNLEESIKTKEFREDLYYRLAVIQIEMPPLRRRKGDIEKLFSFWMPNVTFENEAYEKLLNYYWPGNIRELKNFTERIKQLGITKVGLNDLPHGMKEKEFDIHLSGTLSEIVDSYEKKIIEKVLAESNGIRVEAAKQLGVTRQALQYKLEKYGIKYKE